MYVPVEGEYETVYRLRKGKSIARFGDGELKILGGAGYRREPANGLLTVEMRAIVTNPHKDCLIGIPTMDPEGPKFTNWLRHETRLSKYFNVGTGITYYSAFISRPDSAADNIESQKFVDLLESVWRKKGKVAIVSEPGSKILPFVRRTNEVVHIECPSHLAYAEIDRLEDSVHRSGASVALLSAGPTATCLAHRLASEGVQALDLGSIGAMLMRWAK